jgi:hypothetical protein
MEDFLNKIIHLISGIAIFSIAFYVCYLQGNFGFNTYFFSFIALIITALLKEINNMIAKSNKFDRESFVWTLIGGAFSFITIYFSFSLIANSN